MALSAASASYVEFVTLPPPPAAVVQWKSNFQLLPFPTAPTASPADRYGVLIPPANTTLPGVAMPAPTTPPIIAPKPTPKYVVTDL